ncbi:hypothetical protein [Paenibacillus mesophilus]|nr:hypothetical protein [Paenibacillus mesophilus]
MSSKAFTYAYAVVLLVLGISLIGGCGEDKAAGSSTAPAASSTGR